MPFQIIKITQAPVRPLRHRVDKPVDVLAFVQIAQEYPGNG